MQHNTDSFKSPRMTVFCIKYVINCMQVKACVDAMIKLNCINKIMMEMCLPLLYQTDYDQNFWKESPKEYVYSATYKTEDHNMVKNAVTDLLQKICEVEVNKKREFLRQYIQEITVKLNQLTQPGQNAPALMKECLLHGIEAVVDQFITDREIRSCLPQLLATHLLPILREDTNCGQLAYRVCSLYSRIGYFIKYNPDVHDEFCKLVCQAIVRGAIPTQIKAAEALSVLVQNQYELKEKIAQELDFILKKVLEMIELYDFDGLVDTLKTIINSFQYEIGPHSAKVFDGLKVAYYNYKSSINSCKGVDEKEAEVAEAEIGADTCLSAMSNLVNSNLLPEVYHSIAKPILEMVNLCILEEDETNFPTCISMLNMVISKAPVLPDFLVAYYPVLCYMIAGKPRRDFTKHPNSLNDEQFEHVVAKVAQREDVLDDIHLLSTCLQNFTTKLADGMADYCDFFGTSFIELYYQVMDAIGQICKEGDSCDLVWPLKMGIALLENLNPATHIEPILLMVDQILNRENITSRVIMSGIAVFSVAFLRDLPKTMEVLNTKLVHREYIQKWFSEINNSKATNQTNKIYFIRALLSFLQADSRLLPNGLNLKQVMSSFIDLSEDYIETKLDEADPDYEASEEESDELEMLYEDEDDEWDEDEDFEPEEECQYYSKVLLGCPVIERFGADGSPALGSLEALISNQDQLGRLQKVIEKARRCQKLLDEQKEEARKHASAIKPF